MFTIFFTNRKLLIAEYLPKGQKYNQADFISDILPELEQEKMRYKRSKQGGTFDGQMDHSKSRVGGKLREIFDWKGFVRRPHPPYSPNLSPYDVLVLWNGQGKAKDHEFRTVQDILRRLTQSWNDFTFEDVQSVFREWQIRLNWVMENNREYHFE
jgi:hypothetical protein